MSKYFECHITLEPVFEERLVQAQEIANKYGFKMADLLMQKRKSDTPERSAKDTFCTARDKDFHMMHRRMSKCLVELAIKGFKLYRYKIEDVVLDVRL